MGSPSQSVLTSDEIADGVVALVDDDSRSGAIMQITNADGVGYVDGRSNAAPSLRDRGRTVSKMPASDLGPWEPLGLDSVVETFASAPFRWWISGGHALDLHLGRTWRSHQDTDVGVVRQDLSSLRALLVRWDLQVAAAGQLTPWGGEPLEAARHQNNVWCRLTADGPWVLDVTIGEGTDETWIYRRDPSVSVPWDMAVLRTTEGVPYLAPELQLLYKSKDLRPKDEVDAAEVIPSLDARQRGLLSGLLAPDHPWQRRLA